jgi:hypothetical protein
MKKSLAFSSAVALIAAPLPAGAESGPMERGTFTVGAERLTGVYHASLENDPFPNQPPQPQNYDDDSVTAIVFLGNGGYADRARDPVRGDSRNMYAVPRVGFDYFIINGLSLGGSISILTHSNNDRHPRNEDYSVTNFLFAPRVGYAYMFGSVVGIWPRGGLSYVSGSFSPDGWEASRSSHYFAFEIDVPLIIAPVKNFGITVGPLFDVTFGGSQTDRRRNVGEQTRDSSLVLFGLSSGVMGIF